MSLMNWRGFNPKFTRGPLSIRATLLTIFVIFILMMTACSGGDGNSNTDTSDDIGSGGGGNGTNTAPVIADINVSTAKDISVNITLTASDADDDPLTFTISSDPSNGALSGTEPNFTYTPDSDYIGGDSFEYTANDGTISSNAATVSITVFSIIYVDVDANGTDTGTSWTDATTDIQAAVDSATPGAQIWVAEGSFVSVSTNSVLTMKEGVDIYGGFVGTESSTPTLTDVTFDSNTVGGQGAGMFNSWSNAILTNVNLIGNLANGVNGAGGGMLNFASSPILKNVVLSGNTAGPTSFNGGGGGMHNSSSSPTLINVTIRDNTAGGAGGAMYN